MVLPNGSCQGIDTTAVYDSIYIAGGKIGDDNINNENYNLRIGKMIYDSDTNTYDYKYCVNLLSDDFDDTRLEIEGTKIGSNDIYFGITNINGVQDGNTSYIYKIPKNTFSASNAI